MLAWIHKAFTGGYGYRDINFLAIRFECGGGNVNVKNERAIEAKHGNKNSPRKRFDYRLGYKNEGNN